MSSYVNYRVSAGSENKLLGLELIRFICAVAVVIWHYQHFFYVADHPANLVGDKQPFYFLLRPFYVLGWMGVDIFWCISGYIFFGSISIRSVVSGR